MLGVYRTKETLTVPHWSTCYTWMKDTIEMVLQSPVNASLSFEHAEEVIGTTDLILLAVCFCCHRKVLKRKERSWFVKAAL